MTTCKPCAGIAAFLDPEDAAAKAAAEAARGIVNQGKATIFAGAGNSLDFVLLQEQDTTPLNGIAGTWEPIALRGAGGIVRAVAKLGSTTIDSDANPELFDWTGVDAAGNDKLAIYLGLAFSAPTEGYLTLIIYSASKPTIPNVFISPNTAFERTYKVTVLAPP